MPVHVEHGKKHKKHHHKPHTETIHSKSTVTVHRTGLCGAVLAGVTRWMSLVTAIFLFITGLSHALLSWENWCDNSPCGESNDCTCYGPWLVWTKKNGLDWFRAVNNGFNSSYTMSNNYNGVFSESQDTYGTAFTLNIQTLFKTWVPLLFGIWAVIEHIEPFSPQKIKYMFKAFLFHFWVMFFIAFPCAGNFGIFTGFLCAVTAGCCLFGIFLSKGEYATFGYYRFGCYDYLKCSENKWKAERSHFVSSQHSIHHAITETKTTSRRSHKGDVVVEHVGDKHHRGDKSPRHKSPRHKSRSSH
eukprot:TRINITY_DN1706_c0_g1_i4.p1 TRINITY_DN1706_c0_g1~~TRINITY_DN1706_c0_g1_i4.p1  ORF type:complete len:301 (-),score=56.81 TRINITY_DN1706_c0_g1_i4:68-970(-)